MAATLAALFAAGATLALLTLLLDPKRANQLGLLGIVGDAYLVSGAMFWRARRVPRWALPFVLAWGSTLVAGVAYFSGERPSPLICFYLWVFLYASYFLTRRESAIQIVYAGLTYAALLWLHPPANGIEWWVVVMGALTVAAVLTRVMRERVESLIGRLYDTARTDPLTGLPNRRDFRELLDRELQRSRRAQATAAVLVGDLDRFREVNDRAGHHVGDAALQRLAAVLGEGKRAIDTVARVDGEEFALVLPETDEQGGLLVAERLRLAVQEVFAKEEIPITISFGIACFPTHAHTSASLLRAADEALQIAKRSGGNRAAAHNPKLSMAQGLGAARRDIEAERFLALMLDLAEAVDLRFSGSARHSETVGRYAEMVARELELGEDHIARVRLAGMLHDIGKIAVPDSILRKNGPLTDEEFAVIKTHPGLGAQIIDHPSLADVSVWVGAHHERPDGRGYPNGLCDEQIPLEARIIAVVDAYEAMTSDRAYRDSIGHAAARSELARCAGSQFDERVVSALIAALGRDTTHAGPSLVEA